jgi:hypothetical protein
MRKASQCHEVINMSLIIAIIKSREAIIGGDTRSITFIGDCSKIEQELYSGRLKTDEDLQERARELKASLQVADDREKVWRRGDVLVGEVTEISPNFSQRRRLYIVPGAYIMADVAGDEVRLKDHGKDGCIILGNRFAQELAGQRIRSAKGLIDSEFVESILAEVSSRTPSVSKQHSILTTEVRYADPMSTVSSALCDDAMMSGWRPCGLQ